MNDFQNLMENANVYITKDYTVWRFLLKFDGQLQDDIWALLIAKCPEFFPIQEPVCNLGPWEWKNN